MSDKINQTGIKNSTFGGIRANEGIGNPESKISYPFHFVVRCL